MKIASMHDKFPVARNRKVREGFAARVWAKPIETKTNSVWVKPVVEVVAKPARAWGMSRRYA